MMQMPTGTGKTVVLTALVKQYLSNTSNLCQVLIVAHRIELIEQTGVFLKQYGIDYGVIAGGKWPTTSKQVMVASVQTLANNLSKTADLSITPNLVIIDEAHHALAKTYQMLWTAWPKARFLGLTATPYRMSGDGFTDLFEVLVDSWSIKRFIADGWLSTYDYYSIRPDSEDQRMIDSVKKRGADGDFQLKEMREKLDVRPSIERLFESFERFAFDKKGIIYAIDITHAEHIAEFYRQQGVAATAISSKTPAKEREEMIRNFRGALSPKHEELGVEREVRVNGQLQILVSVDLFSEGFDCPDVEFIQLARPTLSLAKYLQMVGRGLRPRKGKSCCTIIDNVGLYRTFGLPSVDRDWEKYFVGSDALGALDEESSSNESIGDRNLAWLGIRDETDTDIVKIVSHEGMASRFIHHDTVSYFERRKKGKLWVWVDRVTGVEFDSHPKVIDYSGLELSTADGETFFPRISSKWIDAKHGINRKALETQVGDGIGWQKLYISLSDPTAVYQLQEVEANQVRIYKDEHGKVFLQQDLDHAPICEEEAGSRKAFMARCDSEQKSWQTLQQQVRVRFLSPGKGKFRWLLPKGATKEQEGDFYHIRYKEQEERKEFWVDWATGFMFQQCPVILKRGFVKLLFDGDITFVLNINEERFMPYHNWEIRADDNLCVIGNKLYLAERNDKSAYRIKRRSDDFRMFVVESKFQKDKSGPIAYRDLTIINKSGKKLEIR